MKALEPQAHHVCPYPKLLGNLRSRLSLAGLPDDLGAFEFPHRGAARMHQALNRLVFILGQLAQSHHRLTSLLVFLAPFSILPHLPDAPFREGIYKVAAILLTTGSQHSDCVLSASPY